MPTISRFFMAPSLPAKTMLVVFCPFAAGYFLSFFFRNVNAVISKDLAGELELSPSDLGFLTSMYLLAFAAFQLPLGVLLDRYGPRRVVATLLCVAATGAFTFAVARDFTMLSVGRALIGLGVSAGLMGAIKAFTLWFPLSRLALRNGLYLAAGGIGGLSATAPAQALIEPLGWRGPVPRRGRASGGPAGPGVLLRAEGMVGGGGDAGVLRGAREASAGSWRDAALAARGLRHHLPLAAVLAH